MVTQTCHSLSIAQVSGYMQAPRRSMCLDGMQRICEPPPHCYILKSTRLMGSPWSPPRSSHCSKLSARDSQALPLPTYQKWSPEAPGQ